MHKALSLIIGLLFFALPASCFAWWGPTTESQRNINIAFASIFIVLVITNWFTLLRVGHIKKLSALAILGMGSVGKVLVFVLLRLAASYLFPWISYNPMSFVIINVLIFVGVDVGLLMLRSKELLGHKALLTSLIINGSIVGAALLYFIADILLYERIFFDF